MNINLSELPVPDEFGNYWLGDKYDDPVIFKRMRGKKKCPKDTMYMVSLGRDGVIFDGIVIKEFASPEYALRSIRKFYKGRSG